MPSYSFLFAESLCVWKNFTIVLDIFMSVSSKRTEFEADTFTNFLETWMIGSYVQ